MTTSHFQESLINRIRVDIATHRIKTYGEVAAHLQLGEQLFTLFPSLKHNERISIAAFNALIQMLPQQQEKHLEAMRLSGKMHGEHQLDSCNWLPPHNPAQVCTLFPHQRKAAKDMAYRLFIDNVRGVLLQAAAGDGKTIIYNQVIRWCHDKQYFKDCYSPWPVLVITKSAQETLVKQTERVSTHLFGLQVPRQVYVISYDALRSSKGLSRMIQKEKKHVDGELRIIYSWIRYLNPKVIVVDECQACRREDSIQHKVILALAEIETEIKVIFSSATAATRVSEFKCIVCNVGMEI